MSVFKKKKKSRDLTPYAILTPDSPFAYKEAYKLMRTNLNFMTASINTCKRIVVTSSTPNEGKSVYAINLAISLAENGSRVLLIDCDLRKPALHRYLRVKENYVRGLSTVLSGAESLSDCVFFHPKHNFSFILAGTIPPNPSEMLGSNNMKELLESLESSFDYIILDAPPAGMVADPLVLSKFVDGVVLVVRQGVTHRNQVRSVKQSLLDVNANILGVVLNRCDIRDVRDRYSYHRYGYSYVYGYGNGELQHKENQ